MLQNRSSAVHLPFFQHTHLKISDRRVSTPDFYCIGWELGAVDRVSTRKMGFIVKEFRRSERRSEGLQGSGVAAGCSGRHCPRRVSDTGSGPPRPGFCCLFKFVCFDCLFLSLECVSSVYFEGHRAKPLTVLSPLRG